MIVDASVVIDAVVDDGPLGDAARDAIVANPGSEPLLAPGHFSIEIMSGLRAAANRPGHPLRDKDIDPALRDAAEYRIEIEATPWADVHRAWELAGQSLRLADALYVAAAERHGYALLTSDGRIARSGADLRCEIITVSTAPRPAPGGPW